MSNFEKKTWVDRVTSYPLRRLLTLVRDFDDTNTAVMDIERAEGTITEEGDAFSAENMNDLEDRIDKALDNVSIDVDSALSTTSENPVQNKVITTKLNTALNMIRDSSSDAYSSSSAYSVGDYVIYNNTLYKCITACSAGSWSVNSSCFEVDTLTNAVSTLNSNLTDLLSWTTLGSTNTDSGKTLTFVPSKYKEYLLITSNNGSRVLASSQIPYSFISIGSTASGGYHQVSYNNNTYSAGVNFTSTGAVLFANGYAILLGR